MEQLAAAIGSADPAELWAAVSCWACRPTPSSIQAEVRQRLVVAVSDHLNPLGEGVVDKSLLRELYALMPTSDASEADLVLMPDLEHGWSVDGRSHLVHPSSHDRPMRDLGEMARAASVADPVLVDRFGFGVADLMELHLRHSDLVMRTVLERFEPGLREPRPDEIGAYAALPSLEAIADLCTDPGRAQSALDWATKDTPIRIATTVYDGDSTPALRVATAAGVRDLPPAVAFGCLTVCGQALMSEAAKSHPELLPAYRLAVADEAFELLSQIASVKRNDQFTGVAEFDRHRVLEVVVEANFSPKLLASGIAAVERRGLPRNANLGLIIAVQPSYTEYVTIGLTHRQMLGIEDLKFVQENSARNEDLYFFLESAADGRLGRVTSWDMLDQYSVWEEAGEMPHGRATFVSYSASGCRIEWDRAGPSTEPIQVQHSAFPHRSMRTRAQQKIYWALDDPDLPPGTVLRGPDAAAFLKDHVVPAAGKVVEDLIESWDREGLLFMACSQVEVIEALRHSRPAGWSAHDIDLTGRAARLLTEKVLSSDVAGTELPGFLDWQELLAAGEAWVEAATLASLVGQDLTRVAVQVQQDGKYEIEENAPGIADLDAYSLARIEAEQAGERFALKDLPWLPGNSELLRHEDSPSAAWAAVLAEFEARWGAGLEAVLHVMTYLSAAEFGKGDRGDVITAACSDWHGSTDEIACAIDLLTLKADDLRTEGVVPWRNQERVHRLASHPLVEIAPNELAVVPSWIQASLYILLRYLSEGRLALPPKVWGKDLERALSTYRNLLTADLEAMVSALLSSEGISYRANVKNGTAVGLTSLSGEIDHLCVVPSSRTIWVLEEKAPVDDFSVDAIRRSLGRFTNPGAYIDKLDRKVRDVERDARAVAAALGEVGPGKWRVRRAFVTPRPIPAGFARSDHVFVTPRNLLPLLLAAQEKRRRRRR